MILESVYNISNITDKIFQIRERIYSVTEIITEETDDEGNFIIELDKKHIGTKYIEVTDETDISLYPDYIQKQIVAFKS